MNQLIASNTNKAVTMTSREISELVDSRHDNVRVAIERLAEKGVISLPAMQEKATAGRPSLEYIFVGEKGKRDSIIVVAQLSPEFTARLVDRWQELEAKSASNIIAMPNFSNPAEAARAWAEQYEARQLAEQTKSQIGHRREATAMATASAAVRKAAKLEIELDRSKQYASVKRMSIMYHGLKFDWRLLREVSAELDLPPDDIFDANYGTVKSYHADAWMAAYGLDINEMKAA